MLTGVLILVNYEDARGVQYRRSAAVCLYHTASACNS